MYRTQKGFTLIELIVVIVLLGILGVTALGKFQNMSLSATNATIQGFASEITGGSNINYAASITGLGTATAITGTPTCDTTLANSMLASPLPADYTVGDTAVPPVACVAGNAFQCNIDHTDTGTTAAAATFICTGT